MARHGDYSTGEETSLVVTRPLDDTSARSVWALIGSTSENTRDSFELISNGVSVARTGDANGGGSFRPQSRESRGVSEGVVWAAASPRASRSQR